MDSKVRLILASKKLDKQSSILRWIGGKRLLVGRLLPLLPDGIAHRRYHEPFAGAASLFFSVGPTSGSLSDLNEHLIETYKQIKNNPAEVARNLRGHELKNSESHYYRIRETYNKSSLGAAQAARFVYLNRTCFNGIFRVNTAGEFNVPYGHKSNPIFPTINNLTRVSHALKGITLHTAKYQTSLSKVAKGEFVYLDPPYPPLNGTSYFTHYTKDRFDQDDQEQLASAVTKLHDTGAQFLMTNADLPFIRKLYGRFHFTELSVTRYVSCKGSRYKVRELVVTNYKTSTKSKQEGSRS